MGLREKLPGASGNVCRGRFGMVEDESGERQPGIEMKCPDHDSDRVVITGDRDEAEQKTEEFLDENGFRAKIRNDM